MTLAVALLVGALGVRAAVAAASPPDGAAVFKARCARCHGESGETDTAGARALKVRPLVDDPALARMTRADIVKAIKADAKHQAVRALDGLDDADLEAAAAFVKKLAKTR